MTLCCGFLLCVDDDVHDFLRRDRYPLTRMLLSPSHLSCAVVCVCVKN